MFDVLSARCLSGGLGVFVPLTGDGEVGSVMAAPLASAEGRLGLVYAESPAGGELFEEADLDHLLVLGRLVGAGLQRVQQAQGRIREALSSAEVSVVQAIQARLDPRAVPEWDMLQVAVHRSAGQQHCGDVYDIMSVSNGAAALLMGHVHAQDIHAAISMIEIRTAFRIAVLHSDMPHVVMREFHWLLARSGVAATLDCAVVMIDPRNGAMLHCLAGRTGALVVSAEGQLRRLDDGGLPPLSGSPGREYVTRKGLLGQNETLVLYTAGVLAVRNAGGEAFSEHAFLDALADSFGVSARAALDDAVEEVERFRAAGEHSEDFTILLAHRGQATPDKS
jgi:serine phosphatase RsbU (regulator of sigma subunit)